MEGTERRLYLCKSRPLSSVDILFPSHSTLSVIHYRSEQAKMFKDKLPCKVLSTLHYSETATAPTIPQIALLFTTISQDTPQYNLVGSQCYWFVETVWDALVKAFPPFSNSQHCKEPTPSIRALYNTKHARSFINSSFLFLRCSRHSRRGCW